MLYSIFSPRKAHHNKDARKNEKNMPMGKSGQHPRSLLPLKLTFEDAMGDAPEDVLTWNNLT